MSGRVREGGAGGSAAAGWQLSRQAFDALLAALGGTREQASLRYESLRTRLVRLLGWFGAPHPERAADESLDRIARRLLEGEPIRDVERYAAGVARLVASESRRAQLRDQAARGEFARRRAWAPPEGDEERAFTCLEQCLAQLAPESRALILRYYDHEPGQRIAARERLARELDIPMGALRNRALRLRARLEQCVLRCRGGTAGPPRDGSGAADTTIQGLAGDGNDG